MDRAITVTPGVTMGAAAAVLLAVLVVLLAVTLTGRRRLRRDLDAARATVAELAARVESLDAALAKPAAPSTPPVRHDPDYVITSVGDAAVPAPRTQGDTAPAPLTAGQFVSVAVGESLVRVLSFGYGVRRALNAENRNRIAFEMRREVKRSRKQRRREVKQARRHLRSTDREHLTEDAA